MEKLRNTKTLTLAAMLVAIGIVLGFFKIPISQIIEIRFGSLPIAVAGMSLGPGIAGIIGAIIDVLGYLVKPTGPFFPGFTISGIVSGLIFGIAFVVGIIMNTFWLDLLYIKAGYFTTLIARLPKELIMLPINIVMLYVILGAFSRIKEYANV